MFIRKKLAEFQPHRRFFFNVHLDGMEATHDLAVEREGVFAAAVDGIKAAKAAGFLVCTNTTIYKETDMRRDRRAVRLPDRAGRRRLHDLAGLRLRGRAETNPTGRPRSS